jgi:hypothetical protein
VVGLVLGVGNSTRPARQHHLARSNRAVICLSNRSGLQPKSWWIAGPGCGTTAAASEFAPRRNGSSAFYLPVALITALILQPFLEAGRGERYSKVV